jgi:hypothetical protein
MKNTLLTQSRTTGRLRAAFSFCRHGLLVLSSFAALSLQAGDSPTETVVVGGVISPPALSTYNFGPGAIFSTPLTATTVITGSVYPNNCLETTNVDQIAFTLAEGYKITGVSVTVTDYTAPQGRLDSGMGVLLRAGMTTILNRSYTGNIIGSDAQLQSSLEGAFSVQVNAPTDIQDTGSASYVITLNISEATVPLTQLAGNYIGIVASDTLQEGTSPSRIAQIVNPQSVQFTPIPNENLNARLEVMISTTGAVTGRMIFGPTVVAFTGAFSATNGRTLPEIVIPIPAFNRNLALRFDTNEESLGYFQGSLIQQGREIFFGESIFGWKNTWTPAKPPTAEMTAYKTFRLSTRSKGDAPSGYGFGSVTAGATTGSYTVAGTLADGEKIITNGFYGPRGDVLIYQYLYATLGKGSFSGYAYLESLEAGPPAQELVVDVPAPIIRPLEGRSLRWVKQASPEATVQVRPGTSGPTKRFKPRSRKSASTIVVSDTLFPRGFTTYSNLDGAAYTPPAAGQVLDVSGSRGGSIIGVNTYIYFSFESKSMDMYPSSSINIRSGGTSSTSNLVSVMGALSQMGGSPAGQTYNGLTFQTFNVSTGAFKGTFRATPPLRTLTFEGMMVYSPKSEYYDGFGYYLLPLFEGSPTPVLGQQRGSGRVYLGND